MRKIHYSWFICMVCVLLQMICSGLVVTAFSIYMPYIIAENGFTNTQVNLIITMRSLSGILAKLSAIWMIHKLEIRCTAALSGMLAAFSFLGFYFASSLQVYYIAAIIGGISNGWGAMILTSVILHRWFRCKLALALGISASGSGIASLICPIIFTASIEQLGLHFTFLMVAIIAMMITCLVFLILRNYPEDKGLKAYGDDGVSVDEIKDLKGDVNRKRLNNRSRCFLCLAPFLLGAIGLTCSSLYTIHCITQGFASMEAALAYTGYGFALLLGKVLYGIIDESIGSIRANALFIGALFLGSLTSCFVRNSLPLLFFSALLMGLGLAITTVGISVWSKDLVPAEEFDRCVGNFQTLYAAGGLVFSLVTGPVADIFGSYLLIFAAYTVMSFFVFCIIQYAYHAMA